MSHQHKCTVRDPSELTTASKSKNIPWSFSANISQKASVIIISSSIVICSAALPRSSNGEDRAFWGDCCVSIQHPAQPNLLRTGPLENKGSVSWERRPLAPGQCRSDVFPLTSQPNTQAGAALPHFFEKQPLLPGKMTDVGGQTRWIGWGCLQGGRSGAAFVAITAQPRRNE